MFALVAIGMTTGVYKSIQDVPLWSSAPSEAKPPPPEADEDEEEQEEKADQAAAAKAVGRPPSSSAQASLGKKEEREVARSNEELASIRRRCKNALYVAATV
eukprot:2037942-Lingulodinium_polyedra.AAC.1